MTAGVVVSITSSRRHRLLHHLLLIEGSACMAGLRSEPLAARRRSLKRAFLLITGARKLARVATPAELRRLAWLEEQAEALAEALYREESEGGQVLDLGAARAAILEREALALASSGPSLAL